MYAICLGYGSSFTTLPICRGCQFAPLVWAVAVMAPPDAKCLSRPMSLTSNLASTSDTVAGYNVIMFASLLMQS